MEEHVANVVRSCFYQLRQLRSIRRSLTFDAWRTLVTGFVANRVDYCNAVLHAMHGVSTAVTRRLQIILNAVARPVGISSTLRHAVLCDVLHCSLVSGSR